MTYDEGTLEGRLKTYIESIRKLKIEATDLADKHLVHDFAMDSIDIVNLLYKIEQQEGLEITEADLEAHSLYRFGKLADHIRQHIPSA